MEHDVPYFAINIPLNRCAKCGEPIYDEELKECPKCGCEDYDMLNGYEFEISEILAK
jgi:Zn finger protein HypA/HybF involved in hydrogenase expression